VISIARFVIPILWLRYWKDDASEAAIAENVSITPDGSNVFAGWWLNHMRYASYATAGLNIPVWRYGVQTSWTMPVSATNNNFAGTGSGLPAFLWEKDSPLPIYQIPMEQGYTGGGVSYSHDGSLLAVVSSMGSDDGILVVYNTETQDTIFTRHFVPISGLNGVDISANGNAVVVSSYSQLYVYDIPDGSLRGELYNYSQGIAKISGDGARVVTGTYSGSVYLYEWNGTEYDTHWIRSTADDWVTSVDISTDGSTVACGTMDFTGSEITGGKFKEWGASSGDVLIDYDEYGDEVASVALSATGEYAIAGSWGKYGNTFGDVVTVFYRGIDIPLFQLLDDIDEVGSVFSVAISDSGNYAAAGGKAVHAREFGNGGMLYAFQIRDPLTNDVAVASIDAPGEFGDPGNPVTPTATFINVGQSAATFLTRCTITNTANDSVIYNSSFDIVGLTPFATSQVFFSPDFTCPADGRYRMDFSAVMAGDQDTANNHLGLILRSWHDIQAQTVDSPNDEVTVNWSFVPAAEFKNIGSYSESSDILMTVYDSTNTEIYSSLSSVFGLEPYAVEQVEFDGFTPEYSGTFRIVFSANVDGDFSPDNNSVEKTFRVVDEMMYDDGISDGAYWVGDYPTSSNRKFGVRFVPNLSVPFTITNVRFFLPNITYTGNFDYLAIAKEMDDFPDTTEFLATIENPELPGVNTWASYDLSYPIADDTPLWVVLHWADTENAGPYIGADNTGTIDHQSFWYSDETAIWTQWNFNDWMIRMTLRTGTGAETDYYSGLPDRISLSQNYPNPFNPSTTIQFGLPNSGHARIEVFNMLGQRVRLVADSYYNAGYHSVIWDGKSDSGDNVSSGVYYYRLTTEKFGISKKLTMLK